MASLDKSTVRNEVSRLKADFEQLCTDGKINHEIKILMNSMFMIIELMLSIFLERVTKKNNKNSSIPSSQTDKDEFALPLHLGSKGKKENKQRVTNARVNERVTVSEVHTCDVCGEDLKAVASTEYERRTKIDIIFEKVVEHVDAEIKQCPHCETTVKAPFPSDLHGPLQYGNGLKAYAIHLLVCQRVALNRVQKLLASMINVTLSEASLLKFILRLHPSLERWESSAKDALFTLPAMNLDETS